MVFSNGNLLLYEYNFEHEFIHSYPFPYSIKLFTKHAMLTTAMNFLIAFSSDIKIYAL